VRRPLVFLVVLLAAAPSSAGDRERAIDRAADWLAAFPASELRFDSAVMLHHVRRLVDSPALRTAWDTARARADRDVDHPLRRLWTPDLRTPASFTSGWAIPRRGEARANTERLLIEAVHCDRNGFRRTALRYACTTMRDDGGFYTTHALWGLTLARARGCGDEEKIRRCITHLVLEIRDAQPRRLQAPDTLAVDLFAERALVQCLADAARHDVQSDMAALLSMQRSDGSWGVPNPDEAPYFRYHATAITTWALAACP